MAKKTAQSKAKVNLDEFFLVQVKQKAKEENRNAVAIGGKVIFFEDGVVRVKKKYQKEVEHLVSKGAIKLYKKANFETGKVKIL